MGDNDSTTATKHTKDMAAAQLGKDEQEQHQQQRQASKEASSSSVASTPEQDPEPYQQEQSQTQKRKGGRKPIYATSEERKQRNRQAQAAFRERRTEYIKQLESTIKHHEETLQNLQASHRTAADECLMLRYKNSLLERILIEKGIDVQAELRAKTGSPNLGPTRVPAAPPPLAQPIQRFAVNKFHQSRRSLTGLPPKAEGAPQVQPEGLLTQRSPLSHPTPTSHLSSPTAHSTRSPNFLPQGGAISPSFGPLAQQGQQLRPQQPLRPQPNIQQTPQQRPPITTNYPGSSGVSTASSAAGSGITGSASASASQSNYYPSPFQNHYDQLGKLSRPLLRYCRHRTLFVLG